MRKPNCTCDNCTKPFYCRPGHMKAFRTHCCSLACMAELKNLNQSKLCEFCEKEFMPRDKNQRFCSIGCGNSTRRGMTYTGKPFANDNQKRLALLNNTFGFSCCMVSGCTYNTTYDVHRFIPGKDGGEYIIGNMFAICPNHHAEVTRKIVEFEKINNHTLRIVT